jgi:hypothetical protein
MAQIWAMKNTIDIAQNVVVSLPLLCITVTAHAAGAAAISGTKTGTKAAVENG